MLARSFLSAADLGISDDEHDALIKVLHMLERNELRHAPTFDAEYEGGGRWNATEPGNLFNMKWWLVESECGTAACIHGWAKMVARPKVIFEDIRHHPIEDLFIPTECLARDIRFDDVTPAQAAQALSSYLTTGKPNWSEALATR